MKPTNLADCVFANWLPTIGDPTATSWITVVFYLIACVLTALVFLQQFGRQGIFWLILFVTLLALAINKQLDLQSGVTATGRCLAQAQGWYAERHSFQFKFIIGVIVTSAIVALALAWTMRRHLKQIWLALVGVAFLLSYIAIRAAGSHHFDQFIGYKVGYARINWVFEIGGIAMIAMNAVYLLLRRHILDSKIKCNG